MTILKYNIPVVTEGGTPNPNNFSDEMAKINDLTFKLTRSNVGQIVYVSVSSGFVYDTSLHPTDANIYNKGETGLYNLLINSMNDYMLFAEDLNTYGDGVIPMSDWYYNGSSDYPYSATVPINGVLSNHIVSMIIAKEDMESTLTAIMCSTNESYNGGIIVYAKRIPNKDINFSYIVFK